MPWVESAKATVTAPDLRRGKAFPAKPEIAQTASLSKPTTILCVDDQPEALAAMEGLLTAAGFVVITADGGAEALLRVQERLPDFMITDYMMPGMTGLELCRQLRSHPGTRHFPIILYTGLKLPAHSWLYDRTFTKPTSFEVFAKAIRTLRARRGRGNTRTNS